MIAVIAAPQRVRGLAAALREQFGRRVGHGAGSLEQDIVVIDPHDAKGLEFDGVVIVEPSELVSAGRVGDLYVSMTRPTQRLRLLTTGELPAGIEV